MAASYANIDQGHSPYGSGDPYYSQSTGYITPAMPQKKGLSNWIKIGVPVAIIAIVGAVVGGVVGSHNSGSSKSSSSSSDGGSGGGSGSGSPAAASSAVSAKNNFGRFATATDSYYMVPVYPSTTNSAVLTSPTFVKTSDSKASWPSDPFSPSSPSPTTVRTDRPRLIAPAYKWQALQTLIPNDPYLKGWNATIFGNATAYYSLDPVKYFMDGDSGILDNARETKMRIKAFGYAYRMTNDTKWVDRAWLEIQNVAGNGTNSFGSDPDRWNSGHFLDVAEFTAAYAIAYDWMYDAWTDAQKESIRFTMIKYGLEFGVQGYTNSSVWTAWWKTDTFGNWNCVCNGGLTLGSLAILGDDTTGIAEQLLGLTVDNAKANCANAVSSDGTWNETANYWYFGTTGHAEMSSALQTATGSDYDLLSVNSNFALTGLYHMHAYGPTSLFDWGDHGPNKFSTTANGMFLYAKAFNHPEYALFQRDRADAAEPWSMFWYDPTVTGAYWDGMALDHVFDDPGTYWMAMRSSWTDVNALYVGIKAAKLLGHQTHGDLDAGDFVIDALGYRWAGEFGSGNYRSDYYFSNETQESARWLYYRKRTEGQNCIVVNQQNQLVTGAPTIKYDTSKTTQGSSTVFQVPSGSTAFFTADLTSAYADVTSFKRGIRMLNDRKQVLLQDEINASQGITWIMHTNATVTVDDAGTTATLKLFDQTMTMQILNAPSGAKFTTQTPSQRFADDPATPTGPAGADDNDQPNPGVTSMFIVLPSGQYNIQVLFNPQWPGMSSSDFKTPSEVDLDSWSLTSHN